MTWPLSAITMEHCTHLAAYFLGLWGGGEHVTPSICKQGLGCIHGQLPSCSPCARTMCRSTGMNFINCLTSCIPTPRRWSTAHRAATRQCRGSRWMDGSAALLRLGWTVRIPNGSTYMLKLKRSRESHTIDNIAKEVGHPASIQALFFYCFAGGAMCRRTTINGTHHQWCGGGQCPQYARRITKSLQGSQIDSFGLPSPLGKFGIKSMFWTGGVFPMAAFFFMHRIAWGHQRVN